jgi:hypothetical protein
MLIAGKKMSESETPADGILTAHFARTENSALPFPRQLWAEYITPRDGEKTKKVTIVSIETPARGAWGNSRTAGRSKGLRPAGRHSRQGDLPPRLPELRFLDALT